MLSAGKSPGVTGKHSSRTQLVSSWPPRTYSATSAPTEPKAKHHTCSDGAGQLLAITDWNEASLLVSNLDHAHRDGSRSPATTTSFTPGPGIPHPSGARSGSVSISYFCDRNDRLSLRRDGFSVDRLNVGLSENAVFERL